MLVLETLALVSEMLASRNVLRGGLAIRRSITKKKMKKIAMKYYKIKPKSSTLFSAMLALALAVLALALTVLVVLVLVMVTWVLTLLVWVLVLVLSSSTLSSGSESSSISSSDSEPSPESSLESSSLSSLFLLSSSSSVGVVSALVTGFASERRARELATVGRTGGTWERAVVVDRKRFGGGNRNSTRVKC